MDWKIFFSTFVIVFLAELGDKTQLTALAASSGTKSTWSVFAGAALALVISTLIAVLVGSVLQKVLPLRIIRILAGILFLIFGTVLIISAIRNQPEEEPVSEAVIRPGILSELALRSASQFEHNRAEGYYRMAESIDDARLKSLLTNLADSEMGHSAKLENTIRTQEIDETELETEETIPYPETSPNTDQSDIRNLLETVINEEITERDFYRKLAQTTRLPNVQQVYLLLAQEEERHVNQLKDYLETL